MRDIARHTIQLVARRTGLTPAVIRAWERRYAAIHPVRTPSHRRLYSDIEVERLRLLRRATMGGRRIGAIAVLADRELADMIREDELAAARVPRRPGTDRRAEASAFVDSALDAVHAMDEDRLESVLHRARLELSTFALMDSLLFPLLRTVGERWENGTLEIYHEHLATSLIRSLLETLRRSQPRADGPDIVITTPSGQTHELGAQMVALTAAASGWRVTYLGIDLPADQIADAARRIAARAVALSLVHPAHDGETERELAALGSRLPRGSTVLVGGRAASSYESVLHGIGALTPSGLDGLRVELDRLARA